MIENRFRDWYGSRASRPLILGHRGDSFRAPENTIEAARLALEAGADGWELDVQRTLDGALIVFHDRTLTRTTDVADRFAGDVRAANGFRVADFRLSEIRSLDAGRWFLVAKDEPRSAEGFGTLERINPSKADHFRSGEVRIPTLREALELTIAADAMVNVEIKSTSTDVTGLVESVIAEIRISGASHRVTISSFDHAMVAMVATLEPGIATGALVDRMGDLPALTALRSLGADALHVSALAVDLAEIGLPTLVYTINDTGPSGLAVRLAERGILGLFTDDPAAMARLFGIIPSSTHTRRHSGIVEHPWAGR